MKINVRFIVFSGFFVLAGLHAASDISLAEVEPQGSVVFGGSATQPASEPKTAADLLSARVQSTTDGQPHWYIITGGPGTGKSSVINELAKRGHGTVEESATTVIAQELARGEKTPWSESWFEGKVAELMHQRQEAVRNDTRSYVFFDRGPVDPISYVLWYKKPLQQPVINKLNGLLVGGKFKPVVFLLEDLGFCENTEIRSENLKQLSELQERLHTDYTSLGFEAIIVPRGSIQQRADFILAYIDAAQEARSVLSDVLKTPESGSVQEALDVPAVLA